MATDFFSSISISLCIIFLFYFQAWKAIKTNHAQVPLSGGQTLNLPMNGFAPLEDMDDEQLQQLKLLTKNLQQSVANIEARRGKEEEN